VNLQIQEYRLVERFLFKRRNKKFLFQIPIVSHCNLNCAYCEYFAPVAPIHFASVESVKKDVIQLKSI